MKLLIWKVTYDCVFRSSSGAKPCEIEHKNLSALVGAFGSSLDDVARAIEAGLDNQTTLTRLVAAEYIGTIMNALEQVREDEPQMFGENYGEWLNRQ